jgi:hypothetical protein
MAVNLIESDDRQRRRVREVFREKRPTKVTDRWRARETASCQSLPSRQRGNLTIAMAAARPPWRQGRSTQEAERGQPPAGIAARGRLGSPDGGRIRVPIRDAAVGSIGPVERSTRIAIRARLRANMPPHAPTSSTMANLSAISVSTALPLRHPSKIRGRRHGNHRTAEGCACQQSGNKLLHCNPRYGESVERTLHAGPPTSMAALSSSSKGGGIEGARDHRARGGDGHQWLVPIKLDHCSLREPAL